MKKLFTLMSLIALLSLSLSTKAENANEADAMVEMFMTMIKQQPDEIQKGVECFGITEDKLLAAYKKTLQICFPQDRLEGGCLEKEAPKQFGISQEKFNKCTAEDEETDIAQGNDIDYSTLSDEEYQALIAKEQAEGLADLQAMADIMKQASAGTEDKITLPIYTPSTLTSHYTTGMENNEGKKTLPIATLNTTDSVEKVAAFYKKSLPDFEIHENEGFYYVMKKIPSNLVELSMNLDTLPLYFVPHIEIYSLKVSGADTTFIVISYKP